VKSNAKLPNLMATSTKSLNLAKNDPRGG
jgi:hypothetical protein